MTDQMHPVSCHFGISWHMAYEVWLLFKIKIRSMLQEYHYAQSMWTMHAWLDSSLHHVLDKRARDDMLLFTKEASGSLFQDAVNQQLQE